MATLVHLPPSAVHCSVANKFKGRGVLLYRRPFGPPVESHHTSNYQLEVEEV